MEGSQSVVGTESVVFQNETPWNATIPAMSEGLSHQFIYSIYAQIVSGFFVWIAFILTCLQIFQHLRYYTVPEQQLWIVRILFIVPIYGVCSWVGLIWPGYSVYFDSIRSCYEAFVIYNFLRLCLAYLGGEASVLSDINGQPIQRSCVAGTCCFPQTTYSIRFLRFCKQATLQFCVVKPVVAGLTIIMEAVDVYREGHLSPTAGYFYCSIVNNISVTIALYGLYLFYSATKPLLSPFRPFLKFISVKAIIFLSFWQGFLLTVLYWSPILNDPNISAAYQNFLITIEMLFAAILLRFAFPYGLYMDMRKDGMGRGVPVKKSPTTLEIL
ncbi:Transmembrane protein 184B [Geodia barretti]|uniref:Transmembrane protein 184B n=1 Tax=Geodia barretti TaxID=519541 RepID=A0AA35XHU0_GEOBA|nr:Transmembrane protein 184B [Geodia barretti]